MAGFSFFIGDEQLYVGAKTKISISLESILLSDKTIAGAVSFPFNVANNAHNRRLLNISNTLMTFDEYQNVKCRSHLGGNFWKNGFIVINNHDLANINITFTEFNSEEDFENQTLQDLDLPIINTSDKFYDRPTGYKSQFHNELISKANRIWPSVKDYVCPTVFNRKTHDVVYSFGFQNLCSNDNYATGFYDEITGNAISPFLFVNYVLQNLFKKLNIDLNKNKLKESDLDDLVIYTNRANLMTAISSTNPSENLDCLIDEPNIKLAEYLPLASFKDFLNSIKKSFNLLYKINWIENKVDVLNKADVLNNFKTIDITQISEPYSSLQYKSDFKEITSIVYKKSNDEIITDDTSRFTLKGYQYKGFVNNLSEIPNIQHQLFDYYIVRLLTNTYADAHNIYFYDLNGNWSPSLRIFTKNNSPYDVYFKNNVKSENKLELGIDTSVLRINFTQTALYNITTGTLDISQIDYYQFFCPAVDIGIAANTNHYQGNTEPGGKTDIEVNETVRLLFYRGMRREMKDGGFFPFANKNEFDFSVINPGVPNDGNATNPSLNFFDAFDHSLEIDGPKGLWEKFHRKWQEFLATLSRLVTYNIRFSPAQIVNDDLFLNEMQISGKRFIISKLTITGDANQIEPCKTEMYQIEPK